MATNKIYQTPGTAVVFTESGGTATWTPKNEANGKGRVSNQYDRGAGSLPVRFKWEATFKAQSAVTIGLGIRIYLFASENASAAVDLSADAELTAETQLNNFTLVGQIIASSTAVGPFYASGIVELYGRYAVAAMWNASGQALTNTNGDTKITLTPMPDDIQAAA